MERNQKMKEKEQKPDYLSKDSIGEPILITVGTTSAGERELTFAQNACNTPNGNFQLREKLKELMSSQGAVLDSLNTYIKTKKDMLPPNTMNTTHTDLFADFELQMQGYKEKMKNQGETEQQLKDSVANLAEKTRNMERELAEFMKNMELEMIKSQSQTYRLEDEKEILCREIDKKDIEIAELKGEKNKEME